MAPSKHRTQVQDTVELLAKEDTRAVGSSLGLSLQTRVQRST